MSGGVLRMVGLMSGTSADGIDAALMRVEGAMPNPRITIEGFHTEPWPAGVRGAALTAAAGSTSTARLNRLRVELADGFAGATLRLLEAAGVPPGEVDAIACHGQTIWHEPPTGGDVGATLQLLDAATLAGATGIPVVHDFRSADVAAGGHGAPLVAWPDSLLFSHETHARAVLNLGGMANVTLLPPRSDAPGRPPFAFDLGPANALMDVAIDWATDGRESRDTGGRRAARGRIDTGLLSQLMEHPFFEEAPPRSTGRETFGPALVREIADARGLSRGGDEDEWDDVLATFCAFTVQSIERAFRRHLEPRGVEEVLVAGGGVHNSTLMDGLRGALDPLPLRSVEEALGMHPDAREAAAFALLGWAFLQGVTSNVPTSSGASGPRLLGSWTPAPGRPHPTFEGLR